MVEVRVYRDSFFLLFAELSGCLSDSFEGHELCGVSGVILI